MVMQIDGVFSIDTVSLNKLVIYIRNYWFKSYLILFIYLKRPKISIFFTSKKSRIVCIFRLKIISIKISRNFTSINIWWVFFWSVAWFSFWFVYCKYLMITILRPYTLWIKINIKIFAKYWLRKIKIKHMFCMYSSYPVCLPFDLWFQCIKVSRRVKWLVTREFLEIKWRRIDIFKMLGLCYLTVTFPGKFPLSFPKIPLIWHVQVTYWIRNRIVNSNVQFFLVLW